MRHGGMEAWKRGSAGGNFTTVNVPQGQKQIAPDVSPGGRE